ncbi:MAG: DUF2949 domain-containing protein [Leptolyngbyaceae cyanobacterium bins.59]|nr:DUF2949 domain-containing protein [Leptolyngbyaceae cyanobacterium bins.59]
MAPTTYSRFIRFLQDELLISASSIAFVERMRATNAPSPHPEQDLSLLPMILWQYGLVTLEQLDQIFDWMETAQSPI